MRKTTADQQLPLMPVSDHHRENGLSRSRLAEETGYDGAQVTRVLDGDGNLPAGLIAAVVELDRARVLVGGLCALVGCEAVERQPDPAADNKRLRSEILAMRAHLDALLTEAP